MHGSVYGWTAEIVDWWHLAKLPTLEVGSGIVNGTVRDHFSGKYLGVDIAPGIGVDMVADAETLEGVEGVWPVVISTEMLEHVARPWLAVIAMTRRSVPGGHVILTARGYDERGCWEPHGYPHDHWRFSELSMRTMAEDAGLTVDTLTADPEGPGWFLHGLVP